MDCTVSWGLKESDMTERLSLSQIRMHLHRHSASQVAIVVKNLPASAGDLRDVSSIPGSGIPLEEGVATHSNILAWRIPRTEEPGWLQFMGPQNSGHDLATKQ